MIKGSPFVIADGKGFTGVVLLLLVEMMHFKNIEGEQNTIDMEIELVSISSLAKSQT